MNDIEVGEYVRTREGKIDRVKNNDYYMQQYIECEKSLYLRENIIKHSKNIIDLIEEGDYVNGYKVINVINGEIALSGKCVDVDSAMDSSLCTFWAEDIKSIVTKEQFEQVQYKI